MVMSFSRKSVGGAPGGAAGVPAAAAAGDMFDPPAAGAAGQVIPAVRPAAHGRRSVGRPTPTADLRSGSADVRARPRRKSPVRHTHPPPTAAAGAAATAFTRSSTDNGSTAGGSAADGGSSPPYAGPGRFRRPAPQANGVNGYAAPTRSYAGRSASASNALPPPLRGGHGTAAARTASGVPPRTASRGKQPTSAARSGTPTKSPPRSPHHDSPAAAHTTRAAGTGGGDKRPPAYAHPVVSPPTQPLRPRMSVGGAASGRSKTSTTTRLLQPLGSPQGPQLSPLAASGGPRAIGAHGGITSTAASALRSRSPPGKPAPASLTRSTSAARRSVSALATSPPMHRPLAGRTPPRGDAPSTLPQAPPTVTAAPRIVPFGCRASVQPPVDVPRRLPPAVPVHASGTAPAAAPAAGIDTKLLEPDTAAPAPAAANGGAVAPDAAAEQTAAPVVAAAPPAAAVDVEAPPEAEPVAETAGDAPAVVVSAASQVTVSAPQCVSPPPVVPRSARVAPTQPTPLRQNSARRRLSAPGLRDAALCTAAQRSSTGGRREYLGAPSTQGGSEAPLSPMGARGNGNGGGAGQPASAHPGVIKIAPPERAGLQWFGPPGEVVPNLWVGSMEHASPNSVKELGFTSIVAVMRYSAFGGPPSYGKDVQFFNFPFCDNGTDKIPFAKIAVTIDSCLKQSMRHTPIHSVDEGLARVREVRPVAAPKFTAHLHQMSKQVERHGIEAVIAKARG